MNVTASLSRDTKRPSALLPTFSRDPCPSFHHTNEGGVMSASLAPVESYCRDCGSVIQARAEICPKCGVRQRVAQMSGRNRSSAAIFAFFLGWLGVHKFY